MENRKFCSLKSLGPLTRVHGVRGEILQNHCSTIPVHTDAGGRVQTENIAAYLQRTTIEPCRVIFHLFYYIFIFTLHYFTFYFYDKT